MENTNITNNPNNTNNTNNQIKLVDLFYEHLDYDSVKKILDQLSECGEYDANKYGALKKALNTKCHMIYLIKIGNKLIGMITLFVEHKIIHNFGKVCHIEDFVIDQEYRNEGIGRLVIENIKSLMKRIGCYKIILNCNDDVIKFYEKCGFENKQVQMAYYF